MKRILVPTQSGSDWQRLLAKPVLHWKKGASAMTAAACWESAAPSLPPEVAQVLSAAGDRELAGLELVFAIPEWEVRLVGGETTSNTDVMAICRNDAGLCVVGVEAKVLEDFGPLLSEKRRGASAGQSQRLEYLHSLLGVAGFSDSIRYQLLHRTASAILTARELHAGTAVMLVHAFGCPPNRREDFDAFVHEMGATNVSQQVCRIARFDSPSLYLAWCEGDAQFLGTDLPGAAPIRV